MGETRDYVVVVTGTTPEMLSNAANAEIGRWQKLMPRPEVMAVQYAVAFPPDINALKQGPPTHGALIHFRAEITPADIME